MTHRNDTTDSRSRSTSISRRTVLRTSLVALGAGSGVLGASTAGNAASGAKRSTYSIMSGTDQETTVHVYEAAQSGPTTLVVGGLHGDEQSSYQAASQIAKWAVNRGTLVVLPKANVEAIQNDERPYDNDLNRQFPADGSQCDTDLAQAIWKVVNVWDPDLVFSLHSVPGIYGSADGGVGQSVVPTPVDAARTNGKKTVSALNDQFSLSDVLSFELGNDITPNRPLFMYRVAGTTNKPGYLCAVTEKATMQNQIDWLTFCVEQAMKESGQLRGSGDTGSGNPHSISVVGTGKRTEYEFEASGEITPKDNVESQDTVSGNTVHGVVKGLSDNYWFRGEITSFKVVSGDPSIEIWIDGDKYDPEDFPPYSVSVVGTGNRTKYKFSVSGGLTPKDNVETGGADQVSGTTARGTVKNFSDNFWMDGIITSFDVLSGDPDVEVWVSGNRYAPGDFPLHDAREISVVGTGNRTRYAFETNGQIYPTPNVETNGNDDVSDNRVEGTVKNFSDNYWFIGDVTSFKVLSGDSNVDIWISGKKYSPSDF